MRCMVLHLSLFLVLLDTCMSMYCRQFRNRYEMIQCMSDCCKGQYRTEMCQPMEYCYGGYDYQDQNGYYQQPGWGSGPPDPESSESTENNNENNLEANQNVHFTIVDGDDGISVRKQDPNSNWENFDLGDNEEDFTLIGIIAIPLSHLDKFDKEGASIISMTDFARLMMEQMNRIKMNKKLLGNGGVLAGNGISLAGNGGAISGNGVAIAGNGGAFAGNGVAIAGNGGAISGNDMAVAGNDGAIAGNNFAHTVVDAAKKKTITSASSVGPQKDLRPYKKFLPSSTSTKSPNDHSTPALR